MRKPGIHMMVDGQFGSTGKGVLAAALARQSYDVDWVVSNAGTNSGHTFFTEAGEKIVLKQLPTFAVARRYLGNPVPIFLSPGAIVDPEILNREAAEHNVEVFLAETAAMITPEDKEAEHSGSIAAVAGTRQGVGAALSRKVLRDPSAVCGAHRGIFHRNVTLVNADDFKWNPTHRVFVEVSQGFSLGIHSSFYPKTTSRECTVAQALADARMPPQLIGAVYMTIRTFPIRVGNFEGHSSGDCYPDQEEIQWSDLGLEPELTTVTKRPRRIFSFSWIQFRQSLLANRPNVVFVNFMNYLPKDERPQFGKKLAEEARKVLGRTPQFLWGYGPRSVDISTGLR